MGDKTEEINRMLDEAGYREQSSEPQAYREMTPDEIRADELGTLLSWMEGPPMDQPTYEDVVRGLRDRIATLTPEAVRAEQPTEDFDHRLSRIHGAIVSAIHDAPPERRIEFLTLIVQDTNRILREVLDDSVDQNIDRLGELIEEIKAEDTEEIEVVGESQLDQLRQALETTAFHMALPAAIEVLNGPAANWIQPEVRRQLATNVALQLDGFIPSDGR